MNQSDALKQELVAVALLAVESSNALTMSLLMQEMDQGSAGKVSLSADVPQVSTCSAYKGFPHSGLHCSGFHVS
jgi:hypothetical protein